jgi:hypothetical protein
MSRYEPLTRYLESRREAEIPMSFQEVEAILNRGLPASARRHQPWWSNTTTHSHADAWLRIGWKTRNVDLAHQRVVFVQDSSLTPPPTPQASLAPSNTRSEAVTFSMGSLAPAAEALVRRHMTKHGVSTEIAIADLLHEMAIDRRRKLLERFPIEGPRSNIDSVELIREDRDAR